MNAPIPFQAPTPEELDALFPGYHVLELIAQGGMGAVYQAHQIALDRTVALKILPRECGADPEYREKFLTEARAMARLNCQNLISIYDCGEVDGLLFIMMEFVQGQSLYHSAYGIAVDPAESCRLAFEICDGLAHAHEQGILHRDIKPANVLLDLQAHPKIGDFGLARQITDKEDGEFVFGTPHYTAPEVISHPNAVDARADIFSVGVILHELLTSKVPAADPRPASEIVACDRQFDAIIAKATHPVPNFRYASAREMANELRALYAALQNPAAQPAAVRVAPGAPIRRPGAPPVRRVIVRQQQGGGTMGAIAALVVIGVGIYAWMKWNQNPSSFQIIKTVEETVETEEAGPAKRKLVPVEDDDKTKEASTVFGSRNSSGR